MAEQFSKGFIGPKGKPPSAGITFKYNPRVVSREREATYAKNAAALADLPAGGGAVPAVSWIRNEAEGVNVELYLFEYGKRTVDDQLKLLDRLMAPERATAEPPELLFRMGVRTDHVRILSKNVEEELFDSQLRVQQARVRLRLVATRSRA